MTTDQGDLGDEVDQSGQGDEDYQGVLGCICLHFGRFGLVCLVS